MLLFKLVLQRKFDAVAAYLCQQWAQQHPGAGSKLKESPLKVALAAGAKGSSDYGLGR
jgi:hypothetical protein